MKRIIVLCDGTGQSASRGKHSIPTNVSRLCYALSKSSGPHAVDQIVFYQSGVSTQDLDTGSGLGNTVQRAEKFVQATLGESFDENVADGYTFIMNNYEPGDELFIFGFSRGAFTARVLANFVARLGVIQKKYAWAFKDAFQAYRNGELDAHIKKNESLSPELGDLDSMAYKVDKAEIEVIGCWDTVASLGFPWWPVSNPGGVSGEYKHFDGGLVKGIKHAFHALALDECRRPFTPTLWYLPKDLEKSIDLQQCWFPGVHSNVGGGYPDRALANLALAWMIDLCSPFLDFNWEYLSEIAKLDHQPSLWHSTKRGDRKDKKSTKEAPDTEYQGWGRGMCYDSYWLGSTWTWKYRTPGEYRIPSEYRIPGKYVTNETMHASVRERWQSSRETGRGLTSKPAVWNPMALNGFELKKRTDGVWVWTKKDSEGKNVEILEAKFPKESHSSVLIDRSFEGLLRYGPVTQKWDRSITSVCNSTRMPDIPLPKRTMVFKIDEAHLLGEENVSS